MALCAFGAVVALHAQTVGTGSMTAHRSSAVATRLQDGRVLVTGGFGGIAHYLDSAEIYDPRTGVFRSVGSMHSIRSGHTATLLRNGDVLIAGGGFATFNGQTQTVRSAELYVVSSDMFVPVGDMEVARDFHTATLLNDGTVLITGGINEPVRTAHAAAEIYDPSTRTFTRVGDMIAARYVHHAAQLPDGRVLIAGGLAMNGAPIVSAEIYDPQTRTFSRAADPLGMLIGDVVALPNGEILFAGTDDGPEFQSWSEIYNPETGSFRFTTPQWNAPWTATLTLLPSGSVLIAAGGDDTASRDLAIYSESTGTYRRIGSLQSPRTRHMAVALLDGRVLLFGGETEASAVTVSNSAELYGGAVTRRRAVR